MPESSRLASSIVKYLYLGSGMIAVGDKPGKERYSIWDSR